MRIISGKCAGAIGVVHSKVFQPSVDYPDKLRAAYYAVLDDGTVVTMKVNQITALQAGE